jgi:hypothetical protein
MMTAEKLIVGVVSGGKGCGRPNFPGFYTRVSAFSEFVEAVTCSLSSRPPEYCLAPASTPVSYPVFEPTYLALSSGGKKEKEGSKPKKTNKICLVVVARVATCHQVAVERRERRLKKAQSPRIQMRIRLVVVARVATWKTMTIVPWTTIPEEEARTKI